MVSRDRLLIGPPLLDDRRAIPSRPGGPDRSLASPGQVSMKGNGSGGILWNCLLIDILEDMETYGRSYRTFGRQRLRHTSPGSAATYSSI